MKIIPNETPQKQSRDPKMPFVYVAGPYCSLYRSVVGRNISRASRLNHRLMMGGIATHCPHLNTNSLDGCMSVEKILDLDFTVIRHCDAVVFSPGWSKSAGCMQELRLAIKENIPVYFVETYTHLDDLVRDILKDWEHT